MSVSLASVCQALVKSKLFTPDQVAALRKRWPGNSAATLQADDFCNWLLEQRQLTSYQATRISRGLSDLIALGDYTLLEWIGAGRMAGVFKARHRLGQIVAIKILPTAKANDRVAFGRFHREARLAVKLEHANIVQTFHRGNADGHHFIVMEYIEGVTLDDVYTKRAKLEPAEAVRIGFQVLLGLQHMKLNGMVHRDLKPANLALLGAGDPARPGSLLAASVKILDIGLGRALFEEAAPSAEANLTTAGTIVGSPAYMAPEQFKDAHQTDIRSDIYSVGCLLYEALAGQLPFVARTVIQLMLMHATGTPRALREVNPLVSAPLAAAVTRMMHKEPAQRPQQPEQAAAELKACLQGQDVALSAAPPQASAEYLQWVNALDVD
ncbi:MAG: serine/threonine-protein kinase [Gemmataceae bacterium]